ncbi:hypothetical protein BH10BAC4_BH10BAC4_25470 [soil metagenome]
MLHYSRILEKCDCENQKSEPCSIYWIMVLVLLAVMASAVGIDAVNQRHIMRFSCGEGFFLVKAIRPEGQFYP